MVVIEPLNPWTCTGCGGSGSLLFMEDAGPLCMAARTWTTWSSCRLAMPP
jgi:hypothetical protein